MARRWRTVATVALVSMAALPALADESVFIGRWHLNAAASSRPPDERPPEDVVVEVLHLDRQHLTWSVTKHSAPGAAPEIETFDAPGDGTFRRINADTEASYRLEGDAVQLTFKGPAGQTDAMTCAVSADSKRLSCRGALTASDGRRSSYVDVYDKL